MHFASLGGDACPCDRASILVIQDKLIQIQQSPEQILQDLEASGNDSRYCRRKLVPTLWEWGAG